MAAKIKLTAAYKKRAYPLRPHPEQNAIFADTFKINYRFNVVPAGRRCLVAGTRIYLCNGSVKAIEDMIPGDMVWSVNRHNKLEAKRVSHVFDNGVKECVQISTNKRRIECTGNHPFLVDDEWMEADKIKLKDLIAVPKKIPHPDNTKKYGNLELDFLALWLAEGSSCGITTTMPEMLFIMNQYCEKHSLEPKLYKDKHSFYLSNNEQNGGKFISHPLRLMLEKYGLWGKTSKTKFIPDFVYYLPVAQLARFLSVFVGCDGTIYVKKAGKQFAMEIGLANEYLITQLSELFLKFGITGQIRKKVHKACSKRTGENFISWSYTVTEGKALKIFCEKIGAYGKEERVNECLQNLSLRGPTCNEYLPINYEEALQHLKYEPDLNKRAAEIKTSAIADAPSKLLSILTAWRKQTPTRVTTNRFEQLRPYLDDNYLSVVDRDIAWEEITAIKLAGKKQTYDLTVEDNHNFIANGLVTHNSGKTETVGKRRLVARAVAGDGYPSPRYFIGAPTRDQVWRIYWHDLKTLTRPFWNPLKPPSESKLILHLRGDSEIHLLGMDKPERIEGVAWAGGCLDEFGSMKKKTWTEHVRPALSTPGRPPAWCDFIGVPEGRNHYYDLYKYAQAEFIEKGVDSNWRAYHWKSSDILPAEEIAAAKRELDSITFDQEYCGCHLPSTLVRMWDNSEKRIVDIAPGDIVTTFQNGVLIPTTVLKSEWTGEKEMLEITTEDFQTFTASKFHKMRVDGKTITLIDCNEIDVISENKILKLEVVSKKPLGKVKCRNITVDSSDNSYVLANGFDNFNSFVNFSGRCYYNFDEKKHTAKLHYDPSKPLIFCFDFNVSPGVAVVCQEQYYVDPFSGAVYLDQRATGIIGEVHIPKNSTTVAVCNRLVKDWGDHQGMIHIYGDATGGSKGSAKILGSDWDLVKGVLNPHFGARTNYFVGKTNPRERERVNSVNSHFLSIDNVVRAQIDPRRCPMLVRDFEGVSLLPGGSGEIDKKKNLEISHLCFGKGTVVQTDKGEMNIEDLPETGKIKTYDGSYANFKNTGSRGFKKTVKLVFNNGESVICTEDHMFLTELGWKKAIDLSGITLHNTPLPTLDNGDLLCEKKKSSLKEKFIRGMADTTCRIANIIQDYTEQFGNFITDQYPKDFVFTTGMTIKKTTISGTLNCFRKGVLLATWQSIWSALSEKRKQRVLSRITLGQKRQNGMVLQKAELGTRSMRKRRFTKKMLKEFAVTAVKSIWEFGKTPIKEGWVTATTTAKQPGSENSNGKQCRLELAQFVVRNSEKMQLTNTKTKPKSIAEEIAIVRVDRITDSGVREVFCPTVETGCFLLFDQIVVSNSDAYGYYCAKEFPTRPSYEQTQKIMGF